MSAKIRALLVEDNPNDAILVAHEVKAVADVDVAINRNAVLEMLAGPWDVALVDLDLNGMNGTEAIALVKEKHPALPIIIVTGSVSPRQADAACSAGASRFFMKQMDGVPGLARAVVQVHAEAKLRVEEERLRMQAIRDQRLEQLGDHAAGIVHDFNGVLSVVMMGTDQLRTRINPMDERILDTMMSAAKRGAEMTAQVLTFARGSNGSQFKPISAEYLLTEVGRFVRTTFPPTIHVRTETALGTSAVQGDATQLVQVLLNLATNARDAMPKGGTLEIKAQNVAHTLGLDGPCVVISVVDTGEGIPQEALGRIWEPFFTTKAPGHGTGLGLPTVKRIVEAHHGLVKVLTGPDGTSFHVHLPVATPAAPTAAKHTDEALGGMGQTALLVDDQRSFLDLAAALLQDAGYRVLTASNGPEALSHFRVGQHIDVLITDLSMPVMDGAELARNLRSIGLTLPIVYLSGYDATLARDPQSDAVLQKPVSRDALLKTLARVLTKAEARGTLPT